MDPHIPAVIVKCTNPELREAAIRAHANGTTIEKNLALLNCSNFTQKVADEARHAPRRVTYEAFFAHSQTL
jgi:hypothetical protein